MRLAVSGRFKATTCSTVSCRQLNTSPSVLSPSGNLSLQGAIVVCPAEGTVS
jgi:hypothetical protein